MFVISANNTNDNRKVHNDYGGRGRGRGRNQALGFIMGVHTRHGDGCAILKGKSDSFYDVQKTYFVYFYIFLRSFTHVKDTYL